MTSCYTDAETTGMLAGKNAISQMLWYYPLISWLISGTQYECRKFQSSKLKMPVAGVDCVKSAIQVKQLNPTLRCQLGSFSGM